MPAKIVISTPQPSFVLPKVTISLDRRFFEWRDEGLSDPELVLRWGLSRDLLGWDDLLARRRVVILAEAGSGKTEEMREQARLGANAGNFAVLATVEDVDRDGLDGALGAADRARLNEWRGAQRRWLVLHRFNR